MWGTRLLKTLVWPLRGRPQNLNSKAVEKSTKAGSLAYLTDS
jgi:hypothetical protein